jgi:hypothetical protein
MTTFFSASQGHHQVIIKKLLKVKNVRPKQLFPSFNHNKYSCVNGTFIYIYVYIWYQHKRIDSETFNIKLSFYVQTLISLSYLYVLCAVVLTLSGAIWRLHWSIKCSDFIPTVICCYLFPFPPPPPYLRLVKDVTLTLCPHVNGAPLLRHLVWVVLAFTHLTI